MAANSVQHQLVSVIPGHPPGVGISNHDFWVVPMGVYHAPKEFRMVGFFPVGDIWGHLWYNFNLTVSLYTQAGESLGWAQLWFRGHHCQQCPPRYLCLTPGKFQVFHPTSMIKTCQIDPLS